MTAFNQAIILGKVKCIEEHLTKSGKLYLRILVAVVSRRRDAKGNQEERTSYIPAVIFSQNAEVFLKWVRKGDLVHLIGRLDSQEWQPPDSGDKRYILSFIVETVNLLPNAPRESADKNEGGSRVAKY